MYPRRRKQPSTKSLIYGIPIPLNNTQSNSKYRRGMSALCTVSLTHLLPSSPSLCLPRSPQVSPRTSLFMQIPPEFQEPAKIDTEEIDRRRDPLAAVHYSPIPSYSHPQHISGPRNQSPRNTFLRTARKPLINMIVRHDHLSHIHIFFVAPHAHIPLPIGRVQMDRGRASPCRVVAIRSRDVRELLITT